jgi:Ca2+-binding RTX toxin-like protein
MLVSSARRFVFATIVAAAAIGMFPAASLAATLTESSGSIEYQAAAGEANNLTVSLGTGVISFHDTGAPVTAGAGCSQVGVHLATCPQAAGVDTTINLGNLADRLAITDDIGANYTFAGPGADTLVGGPGNDTFFGENGSDTLRGGGGNDDLNGGNLPDGEDSPGAVNQLFGGDGNDRLAGSISGARSTYSGGAGDDVFINAPVPSPDTFSGGTGIDRASYFVPFTSDMTRPDRTPHTVTLDNVANDGAANEQDNIEADVENLTGGFGPDHFTGTFASNAFSGRNGPDVLNGMGGDDALSGGRGLDTIDGGNGSDHLLSGGRGADTIMGGHGDDLLLGGPGFDSLFGGDGNDECRLGPGGGTTSGCEIIS